MRYIFCVAAPVIGVAAPPLTLFYSGLKIMNINSLEPGLKSKLSERELCCRGKCDKLGIILPKVEFIFLYIDDPIVSTKDKIYHGIYNESVSINLDGIAVYACDYRDRHANLDIAAYKDGVCLEWIRILYNKQSSIIVRCDIFIYKESGRPHDVSEILPDDKAGLIQALSSDDLKLFALLNMEIMCR